MRALANLINLVKLDLEGCLKIHGGFIHLKGTFSEVILPEHHLCASMPESSGSSSLSQCSDILWRPLPIIFHPLLISGFLRLVYQFSYV
jgi:hypothetical protein